MTKTAEKTMKLLALTSLLNRVEMLEHRGQEDAITYGIDRVTNTVSVRINTDIADTEAQHKARIRGAATLLLSGFTAYNRDMTRKYGTWGQEQATFDRAYDQARETLESLLGEAYPHDLTEPLELRDITPSAPAQANEAPPVFAAASHQMREAAEQFATQVSSAAQPSAEPQRSTPENTDNQATDTPVSP